MGWLRTMISKRLPRSLVPYGRRVMRRFDQILGYPISSKRRGVVLMLHVGRCGSTVLANMLGQNSEIYWDGKLHRKAFELYGERFKHLDHELWTKRQFLIAGSRYYGFEFKILHDQYPAILGTTTKNFLEQCISNGVTHFVLLKRLNTLRHVVSHYASRNRENWHISNTDGVRQQNFTIDFDHITTGSAPGRPILEYLQEVQTAHDEVKITLNEHNLLEIEYEADIDTMGADFAYKKICDFLDIPASAAEEKYKRVNPFPLSSTIENYDEISKILKDTDFEWMLEREAGN